MKKYTYKALALLAFAGVLGSCYQEQEVEPVVPASTKAVVTIERVDGSGDISEGDTLEFTITSSKMLESTIDFTAAFAESTTAEEELDYLISGGVLSPYSTSTTMQVIVLEDNFPEVNETLTFDLGAEDVGQNWQLNPDSEVEAVNLSVVNVNSPDALTIAFAWDDPEHHSDFDLLVNYEEESWGAAASSDNPEIDMSISHAYTENVNDYDGTYYVGVDDYDVPDDVTSYTISVGHPDGRVETFTGTFDNSLLDTYPTDYFAAYDVDMYRMLTVTKSGSTYTVDFAHD